MAHTIPYDLAILEGTQSGKPLPVQRWTGANAPIMVMVGSKSKTFLHSGAKSLAALLPHVKYRTVEGGDHGAVLLAAEALANEVTQFLSSGTHTRTS